MSMDYRRSVTAVERHDQHGVARVFVEIECGHHAFLDPEAAKVIIEHGEMLCRVCQEKDANEPVTSKDRVVVTSIACESSTFQCKELRFHPDLNIVLGKLSCADGYRQRDHLTHALRGTRRDLYQTRRALLIQEAQRVGRPELLWAFGDGLHWTEIDRRMDFWQLELRQRVLYTQNPRVVDRLPLPLPRDPAVAATMFQLCLVERETADGAFGVRLENPTEEAMEQVIQAYEVGIQSLSEILMLNGLW